MGDNPILFLSRRKMDQKEANKNNRIEVGGVFGHTSTVPESQVFLLARSSQMANFAPNRYVSSILHGGSH